MNCSYNRNESLGLSKNNSKQFEIDLVKVIVSDKVCVNVFKCV